MQLLCLDTDVLIGLVRNDSSAVSFIEKAESEGRRLFTTIFSAQELWEGVFLHSSKQAYMVERLLRRLSVLCPTLSSAKLFGAVSAELRKKGQQAPEVDLMIASVALENELPLVTRNESDFSGIRGLKIIRW